MKQKNNENNHKNRHAELGEYWSNTTLSGNQGSSQLGAPKSHSVSRTGIGTHGVGAIQKLAMALPCNQWKGETKQSETECETDLWWKGDGRTSTQLSATQLSESSQIPLRRSFPNIIVIGSCKVLMWCIVLLKTVSNAIELAMIASSCRSAAHFAQICNRRTGYDPKWPRHNASPLCGRPRGSVGIAALLCRWQTAGVVWFPLVRVREKIYFNFFQRAKARHDFMFSYSRVPLFWS